MMETTIMAMAAVLLEQLRLDGDEFQEVQLTDINQEEPLLLVIALMMKVLP
jgi:hypothetical protein